MFLIGVCHGVGFCSSKTWLSTVLYIFFLFECHADTLRLLWYHVEHRLSQTSKAAAEHQLLQRCAAFEILCCAWFNFIPDPSLFWYLWQLSEYIHANTWKRDCALLTSMPFINPVSRPSSSSTSTCSITTNNSMTDNLHCTKVLYLLHAGLTSSEQLQECFDTLAGSTPIAPTTISVRAGVALVELI